jgi:TPR repeat protein
LAAHPTEMRFEYQLGRSLMMEKAYVEGLRHLRSAASGGFAEAITDVGRAYYFGQGVVQSYPTAVEWFNKANDAGSMRALASLASMYGDGRGVKQDAVKSLDMAEKAVEGGNPFGLLIIATHYFNGSGVAKDYKMAAQYYQQAADLGDGKSMKFLANMYEAGYLGPPNPQKADELRANALRIDPNSGNPEPYRLPPFKAGAAERSGRSNSTHRRYVVYRRVVRFGFCVYVCW